MVPGAGPTFWCATPTASTANSSSRSVLQRQRPPWVEVVTIRFPSGRTAEEVVPRHAADLAWMANLACLELHPHPVRASDLDHPDELRIDLDPVAGVPWSQVREVARVVQTSLEEHCALRLAENVGQARVACAGANRNAGGRTTRCAAPRWRLPATSRGGCPPSPPANGGKRSVTAYSSTITRTPRTVPSLGRTRYGRRPMRASALPSIGVKWTRPIRRTFTLDTMPKRFASIGDRHRAIDARSYSLESLLELSARHEREGEGDAPWPPQYAKAPGEPTRVQPSRRAGTPRAAADTRTGEAKGASVQRRRRPSSTRKAS